MTSLDLYGPLTRCLKLRVVHAPEMPGAFPSPTRVSDPDMHHGICITHVPWCMPGLLTSGLLWSRWQGNRFWHSRRMRNPQCFVSGKRTMGYTTFWNSLRCRNYLPWPHATWGVCNDTSSWFCCRDNTAKWKGNWRSARGWNYSARSPLKLVLIYCHFLTWSMIPVVFNSSWRSDVIWRQRPESVLARIMSCCLTAPSHYLNQCLRITSKVQWHSPEGDFTRDISAIN